MIEAAMLWNEPNNKSHWDLELDPDWERFARMTRLAGDAIAAEGPGLPRVLGGISPIDPVTFSATAALFAAMSLAACVGPARRAARTDPIVALRYE